MQRNGNFQNIHLRQAPRQKPVVHKERVQKKFKPKSQHGKSERSHKPQGYTQQERKDYQLPGPHH